MEIKICGPGCAKCNETLQVVQAAVEAAGVQADIAKVTDFADIAKLGVFSTPAVVVDGQVKCVGKVPAQAEVTAWLQG